MQAKREFDERMKDDGAKQDYEAAYHYWYNRLRKLKRLINPADEKMMAMFNKFDTFRKEAMKRKGMVKRGEMEQLEFSEWLAGQKNYIDELLDGIITTLDV